ncbi:MAG: 2-oxoacid:acceptor oxidoreductase family protein [Anaerolineae bacterium]|nr:2-oxoacid:acceptor oxidoreductase family protein [Anaerolineae bacterium]MDW8102787.1 2-oxoacid:acceptor oxidoreductase family protein [Anaerolineae bacterium]
MKGMVEIRWHGRGGQGVVTAGEILAEAAMEEGKYFQAFPDYGPERMGAPVKSYTRISDSPIEIHSQITSPDIVVVIDPTLLGVVNVAEGLKDGGTLVLNTSLSPQEVKQKLGLEGKPVKIFTVDASQIAIKHFGRNIPNTPMLGALVKATGLVSLESIIRLTEERLGTKVTEEIIQANIQAIKEAYESVREG